MAVNLKQFPGCHQDRGKNHNLCRPYSSLDTHKSEWHDQHDILAHIQPESRQLVIAKWNPAHLCPMGMTLKVRPRQDFSSYDSQRRRQPRQLPQKPGHPLPDTVGEPARHTHHHLAKNRQARALLLRFFPGVHRHPDK